MNFVQYPMLFNPFPSNGFTYTPFLAQNLNALQNYNNAYLNLGLNKSIENTNNSSSTFNISTTEDQKNHYYDNYGDNYYESLKKGIKDISKVYNDCKLIRPKVSLLCNYYFNLERKAEDEEYINKEIEQLSNNLKKILETNDSKNEFNN